MSMALIDAGCAYATALILLAGIFLAGTTIHGFAARHREQRWDHAALAVVCASVAAYLCLQACMYRSHSAEVHALLRRCEQFAIAPMILVYPVYLARLAGLSQRIVALVGAAVTAIALAATMRSTSGLWLASIDRLQEFTLPWGETLMLARGPASPWMFYSLGTWLVLSSFGMWCALRHRREAGALGATAVLCANVFFFIALIHDSLLDAGVIRGVFLSEFVSPALAGSMWWRVATAHQRRIDAFRQLFTHSGDAIVVHDAASGRIVEANEAACAAFGSPREELLARGLELILPEAAGDPGRRDQLVAAAFVAGSQIIERPCRRRDGAEFPAEIALRATAIGGRRRLVASLRDLTPRRRAERALVENELRLRQVIERCPIPVAESDRDGRALALNPSFDRLFGYPLSELDSFAAWGRLSQPDALERAQSLERWAQAMSAAREGSGTIPSFRVSLRDRQGRLRQVDLCCVIAGERMATFFTDLTDILSAREALAEQEALSRAIIEEAADGVILSWRLPDRREATITLWNRRMAEIAQRTREQAQAEGWMATLPDAVEARDLEVELIRPDGARRLCLLSTSRVPAAQVDSGPRDAQWTLAIIRDITGQRRAEEERRQLEAQAQSAQQLEGLGVLAGGIAHDFNNLLMAILGRIGLVRSAVAADDEASRADLREMEAAARRAAVLCQQMLAYAGRGGARIEPVDLCAMVKDMGAMLSIAMSKRATLVREYPAASAVVNADAGQVRQLIVNLVTNASEAIGEHGGTVHLRVDLVELPAPYAAAAGVTLPAGRYAAITIADSGSGMDAATVQRVFEPFFTTKFTGRGLGLAVVLGIVRSHRGGIDIDSAPDRGTTVRVLIPALGAAAPAATAPERPATRGLVLVVDDEAPIRAITAEMLVHLGYQVREAATASEAVAAFAAGAERPRCVILDLSLPDGDGAEVAGRLRALDPQVRIIVASGYARDDIRRLSSGWVPDATLTKPYGIDELSTALTSSEAGGSQR